MFRYLAKQRLRQNIKFIKSNAVFFIIALASAMLSVPFIYSLLMDLGPHLYVRYVSIAIIAIGVFYVFAKDSCCLRMHPATLLFFLHTKHIRIVRLWMSLSVIAKAMVVALMATFGVHITTFPLFDPMFLLGTFVFFLSCIMFKWARYKTAAFSLHCAVIIGFAVVCAVFFLMVRTNSVVAIATQLFMLALVLCYNYRAKLDYGRYMRDIRYHALINHATSNDDMSLVYQITIERIAERRCIIRMDGFNLTRRNVLGYKIAITFWRTHKTIIGFFIAASISVRLLRHYSVFDILARTFFGLSIGFYVEVFIIAILVSVLREAFCDGLNTLMKKRRDGMFLPYDDKSIMYSHYVIACVMSTMIMIVMIVLNATQLFGIAMTLILTNAATVASLYTVHKLKNKSRLAQILFSSVNFICAALVLGG